MIRFGFSKSRAFPIGLDIGHDTIKMIQLEQSANSLAIRAAGKRTLSQPNNTGASPSESKSGSMTTLADEPATLGHSLLQHWESAGERVRQSLDKEKLTGRRMTAALPCELVHIRHFREPQAWPDVR